MLRSDPNIPIFVSRVHTGRNLPLLVIMQLFYWILGLVWFSPCSAQLLFYTPPPHIFTPFVPNVYYQPSQYLQQPVLPETYHVPSLNYHSQHSEQQYLPQTQRVISKTQPLRSDEPSNSYKGFGYHTKYDDGATSSVVFFTGGIPEPNIANNGQRKEIITVASDGIDPQVPKGIEDTINEIFANPTAIRGRSAQGLELGKPFSPFTPLIEAFIKNPYSSSQVFHFYSLPEVTNSIESRSLVDNGRIATEKNSEVGTPTTEKPDKDEGNTTAKSDEVSHTPTTLEKNSQMEPISSTTVSGNEVTDGMMEIEKIDATDAEIQTTTTDDFETTVTDAIS
ncbi:uncharacterized protein LOC132695648 [Cylas formicarius]|uniref:uncharacterized protein LOC132695648 n=1 Tax=Cylas formicarius TaxID=197179 RepID=UPI00295898FB|nr:uncharacterized protein LOC132695648 [Cylas formicarius]